MEGASVFSPWPAWSAMNAGEFDPHFAAAAAKYAPGLNDSVRGDWLVALWGLMKNVHLMLDALGVDPTREDMVQMLNDGYAHSTGVYPDLAVDGDDRFGVQAVHRLEASCDDDPQFHQADSFVTGYDPPES